MKLDKHYKKVVKVLEQDYGEEETWHDSTKELINDTLKAVKKLTIPVVSKRILMKALVKYPKGTMFISPFSGNKYTVLGEHNTPNLPYYDDVEVLVEESSCGVYLRLDGKWADYVC